MEERQEGAVDSWHSYPSIFALGHRAIADLLLDDVTVEEKIDGSQFSAGRFGGSLRCRSKGQQIVLDAPEKLFTTAVEVAASLDLRDGWTYWFEYLKKPKHNAFAYDRVPVRHLILFDVNDGCESYLPYEAKAEEARRLGLEVVPLLFAGRVTSADRLYGLLETPSILGGQTVEGVVIKNYARMTAAKKAMMGKYVSEKFKEVHAKAWKEANPHAGDIVQRLIAALGTPSRWEKAVQHLTEAGRLEGSPRDIGLLIREVPEDVERECREEVVAKLYEWAWPKVRRGLTAGLPEWYKQRLLERQFEAGGVEDPGA